MLKAQRKDGGSLIHVEMSGSIDETDNLMSIASAIDKSVTINLKQVHRINSIGVKNWLKFMNDLKARGIAVTYEEVSPAMVEQINMLSNFMAHAKITSICVPFLCEKCGKATMKINTPAEAKKQVQASDTITCGHCSGKATFDEIFEEYFRFTSR